MDNINIFVSSTCYDLSQVRVDLSDFIEISGHNPILSEYENFPISPELNTIENCIKIVKENADILILIVGNRYGHVIENGKSITNNEFLVARQKGIPIFCFVDNSTLSALNFWRTNKNADFSTMVDNPKIFEFIESIRNDSKIWTFPFDKAQDIIKTLKVQLSYLFKSSLKAKKIFDKEVNNFFQLKLTEQAQRIILEKDDFYEYDYLGQIFVDEIEKKEFLKNDITYSILTQPKHYIKEINQLSDWAQLRLSCLQYIAESLNNLINDALPMFIADQGTPSDLKGLYYVASKYSELYEEILNWIIETRSTKVDDRFESLKTNLSNFAINLEKQVWEFPFELSSKIKEAKQKILIGEDVTLKLTLQIDINECALNLFSEDLKKLTDDFLV